MNRLEAFYKGHYERVNLVADPIHGYIPFTKRLDQVGVTQQAEEDLIDSPWFQRLRRIHQLQAAWWVFPSGEHTRFQHCLGTMHLAGEFANHLYGSLQAVCKGNIPSRANLVETMRVAGLLHDVGHGPFGHFFDEYYLKNKWGITHETIAQKIITGPLRDLIEGIRQSPEDDFEPAERLSAEDIAYLIKRPEQQNEKHASDQWLNLLRAVFAGVYTADNLDYVSRDAYMTGVSTNLIDISRLIYYTYFRESDGKCSLALHLHGVGALQRFLQARFYMYDNIYCHRTVRAIELDMRDIFEATIDKFLVSNPLEDLENYLAFDEWRLISEVGYRANQAGDTLGKRWRCIIDRNPRWRRVFERRYQLEQPHPMTKMWTEAELQSAIYDEIPSNVRQEIKAEDLRVDIASLQPRPENPYLGEYSVEIYDPITERTATEHWERILMGIPPRAFIVRVFALREDHTHIIHQVASKVLGMGAASHDLQTNI